MKTSIKIKAVTALLVIVTMPILTFAQAFEDEVLDTPIDGGLSLLVAAGVGYGAKQLKKKKQLNTKK
jgi:hypothetical protein